MKKYLLLSSILCVAGFAEEESAETEPSDMFSPTFDMGCEEEAPPQPQQSVEEPCCEMERVQPTMGSCNSIVQIGGSYSYVFLEVKGDATFHGSLGGMQASYEFKPKNFLYEALTFSWRQGATDHAAQRRSLLDFDVQERIGYTFSWCGNDWMLTPFSGLGFRYLGHTLKQPTVSDLEFKYKEFYIPVGVLLSGAVSCYCTLGLNLIWMPQVYSGVEIVPLSGTNWVIKKTLANALVELPIMFTFNSPFSIELKPFFQYWQDGKTTAVTQSGLKLEVPGNTYTFYGAELNLGWAF